MFTTPGGNIDNFGGPVSLPFSLLPLCVCVFGGRGLSDHIYLSSWLGETAFCD